MKAIHISATCFDIFYNIGWENWGRFIIRDNKVHQIAGKEVPKNIKSFLDKRYSK